MTIENQEELFWESSNAHSILQFYEACVNRFRNDILIRYKVSSGDTFEFKALTYSQADAIVTHMAEAWKLTVPVTNCNNDTETKPCITMLTDNSIQTRLGFFAAMKLGFVYLMLSTDDLEEAIVYQLKESKTILLVASETSKEKATRCASTLRDRDGIDIPVFSDPFYIDQILISGAVSTIESTKPSNINNDDDNAKSPTKKNCQAFAKQDDPLDTVFYLTSSGSTGLPKLVPVNNQAILLKTTIDATNPEGRSTDIFFCTHSSTIIAGVDVLMLISVMHEGGSILLFTCGPPTVLEQLDGIEMCGVTFILSVPVDLEKIAAFFKSIDDDAKNEHYTKILKRVKRCQTYGAPLQILTGDYLRSKGLNLLNTYGTTEILGCMSSPDLSKDGNKWYHFTPNSVLAPYAIFEPYGTDFYQLIIRSDYPGLAKGFGNLPNGDYTTKDLFIKNGQNNSWIYVTRMDDVINTALGELVVPGPIEKEILKEDIIQSCTLIGINQPYISVIVELDLDKSKQYSKGQIKTRVYEAITQANKSALYFARIQIPDMVYILPFDKQLPKTRKGNVKRKEAAVLFEQEIEQMYKNCSGYEW